ncbi:MULTISPECIES: WcbI family polysaccharide biosynthesis putative acetyltransferase [Kocuria]|nr:MULTISPECIES: WcbI family polysaccharide biosynthesis putative acetyltransferase [Kocuria]
MNMDGRRAHYGDFYGWDRGGVRQMGDPQGNHRPLLMVVGNCQAESLRIVLESTGGVNSIRVPPVFEWTAEDLHIVNLILPHLDALVMQPVRNDYRGLACGTEQLEARLRPGASSVRFPVLRYSGLHPFHVIVRDPEDPSLNPPLVPYHDLRTVIAAHLGMRVPTEVEVDVGALQKGARESLGQLQRREQSHGTVVVSDELMKHPHWHTINHPDNSTLILLAQRVVETLLISGLIDAPGRELLGSLEAPVDPAVAQALNAPLRPDASTDWRLGPNDDAPRLTVAQVAEAQLDFYRARPHLVAQAMQRHEERIHILGLLP